MWFRGALVAVLLLAGLTQAEAPAQRTLDDLLRDRAQAVTTHDERLFTSGVDPSASVEFVNAQRRLFRNLTALPLTRWEYRNEQVTYSINGEPPVTKQTGEEYVERAGRWYVRAATPLQPWDFGEIQVRRTTRAIVLSHPGDEALADRVTALLDDSIANVTEVWGTDWAREVVVILPHHPDELRHLVGPSLTDFAGIAVADQATPPIGQRMVINPPQAKDLPPLELGIVVRHEITHVAARPVEVPLWLAEGFADYVGFRGTGLSLKQAAPRLTSDVTAPPTDFVGPSRDLAYQQAYSICRYLAEERGEQALVDFYRQSTVEFDVEGWRAYLRQHIG